MLAENVKLKHNYDGSYGRSNINPINSNTSCFKFTDINLALEPLWLEEYVHVVLLSRSKPSVSSWMRQRKEDYIDNDFLMAFKTEYTFQFAQKYFLIATLIQRYFFINFWRYSVLL